MKALFVTMIFFSQFAFADKHVDQSQLTNCHLQPSVDSASSTESLVTFEKQISVDLILIQKKSRTLSLMKGGKIIRSYPVAFGFGFAEGAKEFEGDGKTPEGRYFIDFKNAKSAYNKALRVSYPNVEDKKYAAAFSKLAGGQIMIHGLPRVGGPRQDLMYAYDVHPLKDWTEGCIAMTNEQIEEVFALVKEKTVVEICPL